MTSISIAAEPIKKHPVGTITQKQQTEQKIESSVELTIQPLLNTEGKVAQSVKPVEANIDNSFNPSLLLLLIALLSLIVLLLTSILFYNKRRFKHIIDEHQKFTLAIENSPVSILITDLQANIQYANTAFLKTTGYQLHEIIGQNPRLLKSGKVAKVIYDEMWATLERSEQWQGELINRRKDGSEYVETVLIVPIKQNNGKTTHYLGIKQDITERKQIEEQIKQHSFTDNLTGLANRRKLFDRLEYTIAISRRENKTFALIILDLDKFKDINDLFGHNAGDELLKLVSARINHCVRNSDMVARLGGDEFAIVLENLYSIDNAAQVALLLIADLSVPFELSRGHSVEVGTSIGISFYPQHGDTAEILLDHADTALYQAKDNGRGCYVFYEPPYNDPLNDTIK